MLTFKGDAVHGERPGQLGGDLHAAADQRLPKYVLEGFVEGGAVAKLTDHRDGILEERETGGVRQEERGAETETEKQQQH